jgi:PPOX class probable F420-dependent enzyme
VELDAMRARVTEARVARLATIDPQGRPHLVPVCFVLAGDTVYSAVDEKPKSSRDLQRLKNVRANPAVALIVDRYDEDWTQLWWVRLRGEAAVLEPGLEKERALALLARKYEQYRADPPRGDVLAVRVDEWRNWSSRPHIPRRL